MRRAVNGSSLLVVRARAAAPGAAPRRRHGRELVISATAASHPVIGVEVLRRAMTRRAGTLVAIDLAVPPDIGPGCTIAACTRRETAGFCGRSPEAVRLAPWQPDVVAARLAPASPGLAVEIAVASAAP